MCAVQRSGFGLLASVVFIVLSASAAAQGETLPAIAKETYRPKPELPPVGTPPRAVTERLVAEPRVVAEAPTAVVERPLVPRTVVAEAAVATPRTAAWWDALAHYRYGFYDDGNASDNWYYDYYDPPKPVAVVAPQSTSTAGYRTAWTYDRLAEQGLFSW